MLESDYIKDNISLLHKLGHMPTLDLFSEDELKGALQLSKIRKYDAGEIIIEEGSLDCWIYFLVSGEVKIVKKDEDISILKRTGDVFGEMGIIDGSPRSASVRAISDTVCLATDASYIDRLSGNEKTTFCFILYQIFAEMLANRLRLTTEELIKVKEENKGLKDKKA
jgi:CRP/FNR family cyclic AMP-dependent transcriptional regulator